MTTGRQAAAIAGRLIRRDQPMAAYTTFRIGGPAEYVAEATTDRDLAGLSAWAKDRDIRFRVIGSGANLLAADSGVRGLVVVNRTSRCDLNEAEGIVTASAGTPLADVAIYCSGRGWTGLEWAAGIPGTVGGAVVGNAGAFGGYIADTLVSVEILDADGSHRRRNAGDCGFVYRGSRFKGQAPGSATILSASFQLRRGDTQAIAATVAVQSAKREASQPWEPSAGSVFKRTPDHPAGWLIEQSGLKGRQAGGAQISERHANFIINRGGATSADVLSLIELARGTVWRRFGVQLELEIELVS